MDREYIKAVAYYADCLMRLLVDCDNGDFVDDVINTVSCADFDNLDLLRAYAEEDET